jgi:E3 ubiquitin-protein ligase TRIP12
LFPEGGKLEAKTPEGTRVATPTHHTSAAEASRAGDMPPMVGSYAAALKTAPVDWHFSFSIGGVALSNSETVYGAIHRTQEPARAGQPKQPLWHLVPTVQFKKVEGPAPVASEFRVE